MLKLHLERRSQPDAVIKTIGIILPDLKWAVKEITNHRFIMPNGKVNESRGYNLIIPKDFPFVTKLWIGYLNHQSLAPGIYAGLNPALIGDDTLTPSKIGYRLAPDDFHAWILLKQILPIAEVKKMEDRFGRVELKKRIKILLKKVYPFSVK